MNQLETFTSLGELRDILNRLSEEQLYAVTSVVDWFEFELVESNGKYYFHIEGRES